MNETIIIPRGVPEDVYKMIAQVDGFYLFHCLDNPNVDPEIIFIANIKDGFLDLVDYFMESPKDILLLANKQFVNIKTSQQYKKLIGRFTRRIGKNGIEIKGLVNDGKSRPILWYSRAKYTKYLVRYFSELFVYDVSSDELSIAKYHLEGIELNGCLNVMASINLLRHQQREVIGQVNYDFLHWTYRSIPKKNSNDLYLVFCKQDTEHRYHHFCQGLDEPSGETLGLFPDMCETTSGSTIFVFDPNGDFLGLFNGNSPYNYYDLDKSLVYGRFLYLLANDFHELEMVDLLHLEAKEVGGGFRVESFCDNLIVEKSQRKLDNIISWCHCLESYFFLGDDKIVNSGDVFRIFDYPTPNPETIQNAFPKTFRQEAVALKRCLYKLSLKVPNEIFWHIISFASY